MESSTDYKNISSLSRTMGAVTGGILAIATVNASYILRSLLTLAPVSVA
jgi:hypothetical protein